MKRISRFVSFAYVAEDGALDEVACLDRKCLGNRYKNGRDTVPIHFDFIIYKVVGFSFRVIVGTL